MTLKRGVYVRYLHAVPLSFFKYLRVEFTELFAGCDVHHFHALYALERVVYGQEYHLALGIEVGDLAENAAYVFAYSGDVHGINGVQHYGHHLRHYLHVVVLVELSFPAL